ncbi:class I SAM-dependent methyltransferase [Planktothrix sp. FACHB-1365]|uniref:class I SAM-dependent methyltransferase n=1 Tax=Planktothrix sp. FACHB-1365 TaxID=2692855 RepID=UPI0016833BA6|nr:class I SAM-dependent methyltransferase [Planktothrix sp. FACHB-1365]MBD2483370.1 class I SAM-dependent methyltransferase [Planktothrix sp. FACHB-1365]
MEEFLYKMNPLTRFSDRASYYAKYRPSYPDEAITMVLEGLGNTSELIAVDIGAGTGISSRLLAERGVKVLAVEPNPQMRETATPHPLVEFREATAENTNLGDNSVDLVTAFQAFHWFNPELTLKEFNRILKPSGRLGIVWNHRNRNDQFTQEYSQIFKNAAKDPPVEKEKRKRVMDRAQSYSYFTNWRYQAIASQQILDLEGLIGRTQSASYIPTEGEAGQQIITELEALFQRWVDAQGFVHLIYRTDVYLADVNL